MDVYLVNTGWTGGKYGTGRRISLSYTRQMVNQAITGQLRDTEYIQDDMFGLNIPVEVEDVPQTLLNPINAWSKPEAYREQAQDLIDRFKHNFEKFGDEVSDLAQNGGFK